jgi:hypothetical protein
MKKNESNGQVSAFLASYNTVILTLNTTVAGVDSNIPLGMHLENFRAMLNAHQTFAVGMVAELENRLFTKSFEHGQSIAAHAADRTRLEKELHETRQQLYASLGAAACIAKPVAASDTDALLALKDAELDRQITPLLAAFNGDSWPSDDVVYDEWKRMGRGER